MVEGFEQGVLNLVEFAAFAAAEGRWVEENAIIATAATDFALEEFIHVIDYPANWMILQSIDFGVLACPLYHALGGIHVAALCATFRAGQCCSARIGKEVEEVEGGCCDVSIRL